MKIRVDLAIWREGERDAIGECFLEPHESGSPLFAKVSDVVIFDDDFAQALKSDPEKTT